MSRYTAVTNEDLEAMLSAIGVASMEELFADIPQSVRLGRDIDLPSGRSELEVHEHLAALAARNRHCDAETSFLGAGMYDHYVPSTRSPSAPSSSPRTRRTSRRSPRAACR